MLHHGRDGILRSRITVLPSAHGNPRKKLNVLENGLLPTLDQLAEVENY